MYKRQVNAAAIEKANSNHLSATVTMSIRLLLKISMYSSSCLLYTSDAADERSSVDLGGRRIIKKKTQSTEEIGEGVETMRQ